MTLSKRERNIAVVVGAALLLFVADQFAWTPYTEAREQLGKDLAAARDRERGVERLLSDDKKNKQAFNGMIADGLQADPSETESQMLHAIDDWGRDARLSVQTVKRDRMEQDKQFGRIVFRATGQGNIAAVARFLWNVQTSKLPTRVTDVQIGSRQGSREGTDDLTVTVVVSTLVRGQVPATGPSPAMASAREGRP
jgi:type II secretory pathway component PulM